MSAAEPATGRRGRPRGSGPLGPREGQVRLPVRLSPELAEALDAYALAHGLTHGGEPWRAEAVRRLIAATVSP